MTRQQIDSITLGTADIGTLGFFASEGSDKVARIWVNGLPDEIDAYIIRDQPAHYWYYVFRDETSERYADADSALERIEKKNCDFFLNAQIEPLSRKTAIVFSNRKMSLEKN